MTVAAAADELKITLTKKAGSAVTNWSPNDDSAPGSGDALLVLEPPTLDRIIDKLEDEGIGGETAQSDVLNGTVRSEFALSQELRFEDFAGHLPLAMALGASGGAPSIPGGGTTTRDQVLTPALDLNGIVGTVGMGPTASHGTDQPSAHVCPSAMCHGWSLTSEAGGVTRLVSNWYGIDVFKVPAPAADPLDSDITLNATRALIAAATLSSTSRRVLHADLKVYVDVIGGGTDFADAAGQDYVVQATRVQLDFARDIKWPEYASQAGNAPDYVSRPIMPVNNMQRVVPVLTLQIPRWEDDVHFGRYAQNVPVRIRLEWTGPVIESTLTYRLRIDLPNCQPFAHEFSRDGNTEQALTFQAYQAASTPTGFSSADYLRVDLRNTKTSDLLA